MNPNLRESIAAKTGRIFSKRQHIALMVRELLDEANRIGITDAVSSEAKAELQQLRLAYSALAAARPDQRAAR